MIYQHLTSRDVALLYAVWHSMVSRCHNDINKSYGDYGARGVTVCEMWRVDSDSFVKWAAESGYKNGLALDRVDNDGMYSPNNCRWATRREQIDNRRCTVKLTAWGETKSLSEWGADDRCRVSTGTVWYRNSVGWPAEKALSLMPHQTLRTLEAFGEIRSTIAEWSRDSRCAVNYYTLKHRLTMGWELEQALTQSSSDYHSQTNS